MYHYSRLSITGDVVYHFIMKRNIEPNHMTHHSERTAYLPRGGIRITVLYLVLIALHIVPLVLDSPKLWGMDQWVYMPGTVTAVLLVFGLLALVPGFREGFVRAARDIGGFAPIAWLSKRKFIGYTALLAASTALLWYFRNATHFLGDGYLWANHLTKDVVFNEPVSSYMYRGFYRLLNAPWSPISVSTFTTAAIISIAAGLVFIVFAVLTARLVSHGAGQTSVLLLSLLSGGSILLFFGYIEPYPPYAAAVMAYVYFGLRYLKGRSAMIAPVISLVIAHVLHFSAVALLPSLAVLIWVGSGRRIERKRLHVIIAAAIPIGLAALWALQSRRAFGGFFYEKFIPLFPGFSPSRIAYSLFSWKTLFESFNHIVLVCPAALFILAGIVRSSHRSRAPEDVDGTADRNGADETNRADRSAGTPPSGGLHADILLFLETMALFYLLEFIVFNKNIGASRDWDLFAPLAIPLAILVGWRLIEWFPRSTGAIAVYIFAVLVFHTAPWIGLNASEEISKRRFVDLVDTGYWSNYARGYGYSTLGIYFVRVGDRERGIEFSEKAMEADPKNPRYWYNTATIYYSAKRYDEAVELYLKVKEHDPDRLEARNNLGVVYADLENLDLAEREFSGILERDSTYLQCYEPLSYIYFKTSKMEKCRRLYRKAKELGHDMTPFFREVSRIHSRDDEVEKLVYLLEMLLEDPQSDPELYVTLAKLHRRRGEHERALEYFGRAQRLAPSNIDLKLEYALAFYYMGDKEEALRHLLLLYQRNNRDIRVINNIGVIYSEQEKHDKAVVYFERAAQLHPGNPDVQINLARTYYMLGDYDNAWKYVTSAEKLRADIPSDLLESLEGAMPRPSR
jgi:tetratricopeptide (TPR) repeat protein